MDSVILTMLPHRYTTKELGVCTVTRQQELDLTGAYATVTVLIDNLITAGIVCGKEQYFTREYDAAPREVDVILDDWLVTSNMVDVSLPVAIERISNECTVLYHCLEQLGKRHKYYSYYERVLQNTYWALVRVIQLLQRI